MDTESQEERAQEAEQLKVRRQNERLQKARRRAVMMPADRRPDDDRDGNRPTREELTEWELRRILPDWAPLRAACRVFNLLFYIETEEDRFELAARKALKDARTAFMPERANEDGEVYTTFRDGRLTEVTVDASSLMLVIRMHSPLHLCAAEKGDTRDMQIALFRDMTVRSDMRADVRLTRSGGVVLMGYVDPQESGGAQLDETITTLAEEASLLECLLDGLLDLDPDPASAADSTPDEGEEEPPEEEAGSEPGEAPAEEVREGPGEKPVEKKEGTVDEHEAE